MAPISDKMPVFRRKIASFLSREDGKISKEKLIKAGILVTIAGWMSEIAAGGSIHSNSLTCYQDCGYIGEMRTEHATKPLDEVGGGCEEDGECESQHNNELKLTYEGGAAVGKHSHCADDCRHSNHSVHSEHVSGNNPCTW